MIRGVSCHHALHVCMAPITLQGEEDMTCGSVSDYDFRASAATPAWEVRSLQACMAATPLAISDAFDAAASASDCSYGSCSRGPCDCYYNGG